jgi:chemotaxis protein histidine kinase CheA
MAEKIKVVIDVDADNATKEVNDLNKSVNNTTTSTDKANSKLNNLSDTASKLPGPLGGVIAGIQGVSKSMLALIATPLGAALAAIVGVLYSLKRALTDSEEGQNKLNRILSVAGALWGNIMDIVADLGEAIIKAVTEPVESMKSFANGVKEFILHPIDSVREAYNGATESAKAFVKEQKEEIKAADEVAKMRNKADKIERKLLVDRSVLEQKIAELRLKSRQEEEFSAAERRKALIDAQKLEDQLLDQEVEALKLRRDAQKLENTFSRTNKENADKEAEAIAAVNNIVAQRLNLQRATQRELNRVNKEIERDFKARKAAETAENKKAAEERKKAEDEAFKQFVEQEVANYEYRQKQKEKQKKQEDEEFEAFLAQELANHEYREQLKLKELETEKALAEAKKKLQEDVLNASINAISGLQQLLGEDSKFAKALAIAQAIISTYQGASKALGQGGIAGPIAAAGVIAQGLAQVRAITQTPIPEPPMGGGGGGGTPQLAGPSVGIIGGQLDAGAQLQADIAGQMRKPARAYVVGQNVTSQQSLDRHIRQNATLGTK